MSGLRKLRQRTTWTSFHLPSTQPWPTWPSAAVPGEDQTPDPYLGVLTHVPGVENVRLARRVEDVEQAAFIVRWSSADALAAFQTSSLFPEFLKALSPLKTAPSEGNGPSLGRTVSLQYEHGFDMDTELHGRITLNKFTGIGTWESWFQGWRNAVVGFKPLGCEDIARKRPPMQSWCVTWVDQRGGEQQGEWSPAYSSIMHILKQDPVGVLGDESEVNEVIPRGDEHVRERWEFLRWNEPSYGATREREEESTKQPGAMQHWEQAVQRYMPPVQTWVQERWDVEEPHYVNPPEDDAEIDMEDLDLDEEEGSDFEEIQEDDSLPVGIR